MRWQAAAGVIASNRSDDSRERPRSKRMKSSSAARSMIRPPSYTLMYKTSDAVAMLTPALPSGLLVEDGLTSAAEGLMQASVGRLLVVEFPLAGGGFSGGGLRQVRTCIGMLMRSIGSPALRPTAMCTMAMLSGMPVLRDRTSGSSEFRGL